MPTTQPSTFVALSLPAVGHAQQPVNRCFTQISFRRKHAANKHADVNFMASCDWRSHFHQPAKEIYQHSVKATCRSLSRRNAVLAVQGKYAEAKACAPSITSTLNTEKPRCAHTDESQDTVHSDLSSACVPVIAWLNVSMCGNVPGGLFHPLPSKMMAGTRHYTRLESRNRCFLYFGRWSEFQIPDRRKSPDLRGPAFCQNTIAL